MALTVLIVEDERKLRELVRAAWNGPGSRWCCFFWCRGDHHGGGGRTRSGRTCIGLPDLPGHAVARELRAAAPVPILMLTAKSAET